MIRILFALCLLVAAFAAAVVIVVVGEMGYVGIAAAFGCLIAAFAGLRIARRPDAPAIPLQMTVAVSSCIVLAMMKGLPWPPSEPELATWAVLLGTASLAAASVLVHRRSFRLAILLLALPALNSVRLLVQLARSLQSSGGAEALGPSVTLALFVAATMALSRHMLC